MSALYIDRKNIEMDYDSGRLILRENGAATAGIPISQLDRVIITARTWMHSGVLGILAEKGVGVVVLNPRKPERTAFVIGRAHNDLARRLAQYQKAGDENWKTRFSAMLVARKIKAQLKLLQEILDNRPDRRRPLIAAIRSLQRRLDDVLENGDESDGRNSIRGLEGAAAVAYFQALEAVFPPALEFHGRNRRPPRDPVNACMSLAYTLLHAEAVLSAYRTGLDPQLGFYHDVAFGRHSLACDLIEPLRPLADGWIWRILRERVLRPEDFHRDGEACFLAKGARKRFYEHWEPVAAATRRRLTAYALFLARQLKEAEGEYAFTE